MTIKDMHYDFKKKLNKVDSQQYRNLLIPEIDWVLNEAQNIFVDLVAEPRIRTYLGFEKSQKNIDDIRTIVVNNYCSDVVDNIVTLPEDYLYFIKGKVEMSRENCTPVYASFKVREHDDEFENSPFDKSSYRWREVNGLFTDTGIKLFDDGTFTNTEFCLSYIRKPSYIHNAEDFRSSTSSGSYNLPSGETLTGHQNCDLPEHTHREIVDIAVMITSGEIQAPDYQIKYAKLGLNFLK